MFKWKTALGAAMTAAFTGIATAAMAVPEDYQLGFQSAASPVMASIEDFHRLLVIIIVAISLFVLGLLVWIAIRYRAGANPVASKTHHNTILEVAL